MADFLIIGANGGIGHALVRHILEAEKQARVFAVSRDPASFADHDALTVITCDHSHEGIVAASDQLQEADAQLRAVYVCTGVLHGEDVQPEKRLEQFCAGAFEAVMRVNAALPLRWLQALLPQLKEAERCCFSAISARVGSIGDNGLGGWYSYRASKAALNMLLKTASIECARRAKGLKLLAFHPGTTDTELSKPFQANVPEGKLFSTEFVAERLFQLSLKLEADGELSFLDWDEKPIAW